MTIVTTRPPADASPTAIRGSASRHASRLLDRIIIALETEQPRTPPRRQLLHLHKRALERVFVPRFEVAR